MVHLAQRRRALVERREVQLLLSSAQISNQCHVGGRGAVAVVVVCLARERRAAARDVLERVRRVALLDVRAQLLGERLLSADFITRANQCHHAPRSSAQDLAPRARPLVARSNYRMTYW